MISFTVSRIHKPTNTHGWVERRFKTMVSDVSFAYMMTFIGRSDFVPLSRFSMFAEMPTPSTYTLRVDIESDDIEDFYRFHHHLTKIITKNYLVKLDSIKPSFTMTASCESNPSTAPTDPLPATLAIS